jgi:hypothetical protein
MHPPIRSYTTERSTKSTHSGHSDDSEVSQSTAPTSVYSGSPRPSLHQALAERPIYSKPSDLSPAATYYPRSSTETYASGASEEEQDLSEEPETYDPEYDVPEYSWREETETEVRPSTPQDFAEFFPSSKRLYIRHDDTTYDGNMNLRVDAADPHSARKANVQLFHLRMHDLKKREFSLRRYERSSGREVCHSSRKYTKPAAGRRPTALTRSVSNAFASMLAKPEFKRTNSTLSSHSTKSTRPVIRQDSGYGSHDDDDDEAPTPKTSVQIPTNTTKLEFSNYAHVEVKRRGAKSSKRYEFEYWGASYAWKRIVEKDGAGKAVSYHLFKGDGPAVAHIVPEMRSPQQVLAEIEAGGWVPPCTLWISDRSVIESVSDVAE